MTKREQTIYYSIDECGRIKRDYFSEFINNHKWTLPVTVILIMVLTAWIEGNL